MRVASAYVPSKRGKTLHIESEFFCLTRLEGLVVSSG